MVDGRVDPKFEAAGRDEVFRLFGEIAGFRGRAQRLVAEPGSALDRADKKTDYAPISVQFTWQMQIAADHLVAFARLVHERRELPHYSGYVLIRAALESCATALWLLGPGKPPQRILRSLRLSWWFTDEANRFATDIGHPGETINAEVLAYLDELRGGVKELQQSRIDVTPLSRTDTFIDVERRFPSPKLLTPLHTWRVCSSLAHGNSAMAVMALKREPISPEDANRHIATSSWALIATFVRTCVWMFNRAVERFDELAATE